MKKQSLLSLFSGVFLLLCFAAMMLLVATCPAHAFSPRFGEAKMTGLPVRECHMPVKVQVDKGIPLKYQVMVSGAVEYWNLAMKRRVFIYAGVGDYRYLSEKVLTVFADPKYDRKDAWAITLRVPDAWTGCLGYSSIALTTAHAAMPDVVVHTVLRHELGHALGLQDVEGSPGDKEDLMWYYIPVDLTLVKKLSFAEQQAIEEVYGK